jgi:hypothetical protein
MQRYFSIQGYMRKEFMGISGELVGELYRVGIGSKRNESRMRAQRGSQGGFWWSLQGIFEEFKGLEG